MIDLLLSLSNSLFGFILLMGILVTVHEYGHFIVARKLGFKVLKFSIGFGKPLWQRQGKDGVEYQIGMIPLGGYVAMLDERVQDVSEEEMGETFNAQPLWKRFLVVAAGPGFNVILAIFLLWGLYIAGIPSYKPYLATPPQHSILAKADIEDRDLVLSVDGHSIVTIGDLGEKLIEYLDDGVAELVILRNGETIKRVIDIGKPLKVNSRNDINQQLGLYLYIPEVPAEVGEVVPNSVAAEAGIRARDKILAIGGEPINEWNDIILTLNHLNENKIEQTDIELLRNGESITRPLIFEENEAGRYQLGVKNYVSDRLIAEIEALHVDQKYGVVGALKQSLQKTYEGSTMIFKIIYRMIKGEIHINMMAGPLTIADIAGKTLKMGVIEFVHLIALLSINIGMINLMPLPVLDGGRIVGFMIEGVVGKDRIPPHITDTVMQVGLFVILSFMAVVIYFDITRWF